LHLCERRRRGHGGDTKLTARARRRHRDESSTSRFRRCGVQGRSGRKVRTWGRWLDGHTCAGALGFAATARRNVEHGHRWVKQGLGPSVACVRVRAEHRWHSHGGDTKMMACTRQGNRERQNGEERPGGVGWGTYAGERPRVCVSARAQVRPGRTGPRPSVGVCG
jgi:hypothetical protein